MIRKLYTGLVVTTGLILTAPARAQVGPPTLADPVTPSAGDTDGNFMALAYRWFADGAGYLAPVIVAGGVFMTAYSVLTKVYEARNPKNPTEWADVANTAAWGGGATALAGAGTYYGVSLLS